MIQHYITLNNKKYPYSLQQINKKNVFFECKEAKIAQEFLKEDIPALIMDLPNLILSEREYEKRQNQEAVIRFRVTPDEKQKIEKKSVEEGYQTVSSFLRHLALGSS